MKYDSEGTKREDAKAKDRKFPKMVLKDLLKHSQDLCYPKDMLLFKDK